MLRVRVEEFSYSNELVFMLYSYVCEILGRCISFVGFFSV